MAFVAKDNDSEPAWAHRASEVRLYDGSPYVDFSADALPSFILLSLGNRANNSLSWVSCVITPITGDARILSRSSQLVIPPSGRTMIPIAYTCDSVCECNCLVTFRRDVGGGVGSRIHVCQSRVHLVPSSKKDTLSMHTWSPLLRELIRREVTLPIGLDLTIRDIVGGLQVIIGGRMFPISVDSSAEPALSWGCIDPLMMMTFNEPHGGSVAFFLPDQTGMDRITAEFETWVVQGRVHNSGFYDLGVACTTLRDGLMLKTKTDYVRSSARQVARLAGILGLNLPLFTRLMDLLKEHETLEDLTEQERGLYERALAEIDTQVIGRTL